jgi:hypothetical protein
MTPTRRVATFRIDDELLDAMELLRERDGIPFAEQIRRGLKLWFQLKGIEPKKADRKRVGARSRS